MPFTRYDAPRRLRRKLTAHPFTLSSRIAEQASSVLSADLETLKARLTEFRSDPSLNLIAHEALAFTAADGAAIALTDGTHVTCRARAGHLAPPLDAIVHRDSGLAGACMRTGEVMLCHDTEIDPRVNPSACRESGIRSMLVVPLRDDDESVGVLAVFSGNASQFADRETEGLLLLSTAIPTPSTPDAAATESIADQEEPAMSFVVADGHTVTSSPVAQPTPSAPKRSVPSARQIASSLTTIRNDAALQVLGRVKAYLTIESLYDGHQRTEAIELCQELMFQRAEELGVTLRN